LAQFECIEGDIIGDNAADEFPPGVSRIADAVIVDLQPDEVKQVIGCGVVVVSV